MNSLKLDIMLEGGRIETAQEYQFDHVGLGPIEDISVIVDNLWLRKPTELMILITIISILS